jgi:hypothetical protein
VTPRLMIEAMAKHLPPSASTVRLADVNGAAGDVLRELRADLDILPVSGETWTLDANNLDAIIAYDHALEQLPLGEVLNALRPGGRLIVVDPKGETHRDHVLMLENAGYTRILVEAAVEHPVMVGVLMRGEKPHTTADTTARVNLVAERDSAATDLSHFKGRYLHLLIRQTPNKPAWALTPQDKVTWEAVALQQGGETVVLAFSSLPNAVSFMQAAVLAGTIRDVNKVGKFSRKTAETWQFQILLNPSSDMLGEQMMGMIPIDPATAETQDE